MKQSNHKRSGIFLLEIMIAILFFAITSAVCLRSFVKAHTLSVETAETEQAISHMEDAAELINSIDSSKLKESATWEALFSQEFPDCETQEDHITIFYDSNWKSCKKTHAAYQISVWKTNAENSMYKFRIRAFKADRTKITHLTVERYGNEE